jgi:tripeptide aminopeptidase
MQKLNVQLLKEILAIPSYFQEEGDVRDFVKNHLEQHGFSCYVDQKGNLYGTIGEPVSNKYYPCFVAHMDTVHRRKEVDIVECEMPNSEGYFKDALKAQTKEGLPYGLGADDKAGIFEAIEVAKNFDYFKVAFFVEEEYGCKGSAQLDLKFFENVSYVVQFDGPEQMVTQVCMDQVLFESNTEFGKGVISQLNLVLGDKHSYFVHPYTDVWQIKAKTDLCCVNLPAGYYNMHTMNEYVVLEDVENSIEIGINLVKALDNSKQYLYSAKESQKKSKSLPRGWHESKTPIC